MKLKRKWKIIFFILFIILIIFISIRYIGNMGLKVREYKVVNDNLKSFYGFKVVHFSDLNYGMSVDEKKLKILIDKINMTKPDLVVFTGDLISKEITITNDIVNILTKNLKQIKSTNGKYYVDGDDDKVNKSYSSIMSKSNFKSLNDSFDIIYSKDNKKIFLSGIDVDKVLNSDVIENMNLNDYDYKILLNHYPDKIDDVLKYDYDLILCGHSLNGQVRLPVIGKIATFKNSKKYYDPYYKIDDTDIYISGGIGNKYVNFRLFNTPSFNLYRFVNK